MVMLYTINLTTKQTRVHRCSAVCSTPITQRYLL